MVQLVERLLCDQKVVGLIPGWGILNTTCSFTLPSALRKLSKNWSAPYKYNVTEWNIMPCLGHDISVRQHSKNEHWAPYHIQTQSRYDWKVVENDVNPSPNTADREYNKQSVDTRADLNPCCSNVNHEPFHENRGLGAYGKRKDSD